MKRPSYRLQTNKKPLLLSEAVGRKKTTTIKRLANSLSLSLAFSSFCWPHHDIITTNSSIPTTQQLLLLLTNNNSNICASVLSWICAFEIEISWLELAERWGPLSTIHLAPQQSRTTSTETQWQVANSLLYQSQAKVERESAWIEMIDWTVRAFIYKSNECCCFVLVNNQRKEKINNSFFSTRSTINAKSRFRFSPVNYSRLTNSEYLSHHFYFPMEREREKDDGRVHHAVLVYLIQQLKHVELCWVVSAHDPSLRCCEEVQISLRNV